MILGTRKKTRPVRGVHEDVSRYSRCWYCGFPCDVQRDSYNTSATELGVSVENYSETLFESPLGNGPAVLESALEHFQIAPKVDAAGEEVAPEFKAQAVVVSGCPHCGTPNWRG